MNTPTTGQSKKWLSAVCGLYCASCTIYIGTKEDPQRVKAVAERHQQQVEEWMCEGCRSDRKSWYCEHECYMAPCAAEKGIDFCGECEEYPCAELKAFQAARPHRIELWEAQEQIARVGYAQWFDDMHKHTTCPQCGTINSAYDLTCRKCGTEPSCRYVQLHKQAITDYVSKRG